MFIRNCPKCLKELTYSNKHTFARAQRLNCVCTHCVGGRPPESVENRFWRRVQKSNECWNWSGSKSKFGYGKFSLASPRRGIYAHRFSWILHNGPIPKGKWVLHICDNPPCTNPEHLFLGDATENMHDRNRKGRDNQFQILTDDQVRCIRAIPKTWGSGIALSKQFGVSPQIIWQIRSRISYIHVN